jgi:hypothetical protein
VALIILVVIAFIIAYAIRSRLMRKELSTGPNKILLLPDDLEFTDAHSSTMLSNPAANRSQVSVKSDDHADQVNKNAENKSIKIAKYKVFP